MSTQVCNPCAEVPECWNDFDKYSLQDDLYGDVFTCPPNVFCGPPQTLYLACCDGTTMRQDFPQGITYARRQALINELVARCERRLLFCDNPPPPPPPPPPPYEYFYSAPASCTVYCPDGTPFTYTVPAGTFVSRNLADAQAAAKQLACLRAPLYRICLSGLSMCACAGATMNGWVAIDSSNPPFSVSVAGGTPPPGASFVAIGNKVYLRGVPSTGGNYTFVLRVVDPFGNAAQNVFVVKVVQITNATALDNGTVGAAYSQQLTATGGAGSYTWSVVSGSLPAGLALSTSGAITGTPTTAQTKTFRVAVRDAECVNPCTKNFTIEIEAAVVPRWAHWPMEVLSGSNLVDCVTGIAVPFTVNTFAGRVDYAFVAGLQNNAIHFFDSPGTNTQVSMGVPAVGIASLKHDGTGFALCAWIFINSVGDPNPFSTAYGSMQYYGDGLAANGGVRFYYKNGAAFFVATDGIHLESIAITLPSTGAWHFLHMFQDMTAGKMGIQWDMGAITYASFTPTQLPSTTGLVQVYQASGGWIPNDWIVDEVSLRLDSCFTAAQLAYLYNSGAGRTCPMTLP